jgi:hypothetical protein
MTEARRMESLQWRRGDVLGVRRAQDVEAKNAQELCFQCPAGGPKRVAGACKTAYTGSNDARSWRYSVDTVDDLILRHV